ncbi:hypothetical protein ACRQ5Q_14775 [Bradyrhizobium sp. PMVTL-01]|uniref:hypothetical protein n=1 Tax=Bradyrhizobium sp. PMVTL-01 TaxID=3434999 RepID=UPI003F729686
MPFTIINYESGDRTYTGAPDYASFDDAWKIALTISQESGIPQAVLRGDEMVWNYRDGITNAF